jgi:hypothetical protein
MSAEDLASAEMRTLDKLTAVETNARALFRVVTTRAAYAGVDFVRRLVSFRRFFGRPLQFDLRPCLLTRPFSLAHSVITDVCRGAICVRAERNDPSRCRVTCC